MDFCVELHIVACVPSEFPLVNCCKPPTLYLLTPFFLLTISNIVWYSLDSNVDDLLTWRFSGVHNPIFCSFFRNLICGVYVLVVSNL